LAVLAVTFLAAAVVPDEKIVRLKLLVLEAGAGLALLAFLAAGLWEGWSLPRSPLLAAAGLFSAVMAAFWLFAPDRSLTARELRRAALAGALCAACAAAALRPRGLP